ncbi:MAG: serine/threonine protein phosphatase [Bacteroidales bacterium]|nr:serine/threonine protein phosphatase [Bacteroidales bacterium]
MRKAWVIPDIHGCSKTLKALIEDMIKPSKYDWLYFLGDYIDRGPDSKGVIDYLMHLQEEEYNSRFLMGNHEDVFLKTYEAELQKKKILGIKLPNPAKKDWFDMFGRMTLGSFSVKNISDIPEKYINWIRELELYIELEKYILVHAGLNFSIENPFDDKESMLWIRDYKIIPKKINHKKIIHGHTPVSLEFIYLMNKKRNYHFLDLDNGCCLVNNEGYGNLVAYELNTHEIVVQNNIEF